MCGGHTFRNKELRFDKWHKHQNQILLSRQSKERPPIWSKENKTENKMNIIIIFIFIKFNHYSVLG